MSLAFWSLSVNYKISKLFCTLVSLLYVFLIFVQHLYDNLILLSLFAFYSPFFWFFFKLFPQLTFSPRHRLFALFLLPLTGPGSESDSGISQ